jgi:Mg-chelatase subunit ChlD
VVRGLDDPWPENDTLAAFTATSEQPGILVLSESEAPPITALLVAAGRRFAIRRALPTIDGLASVRQIILSEFALTGLSSLDIATLRSFAADLGGSVLVVQGEGELRGYSGERLEAILPVTYSVPERADEAGLALVFLLDRSSSMRAHAEGGTKIEILQEAAAASVRTLAEQELIGILAFDREYAWLSPIAPVGDGEAIYERLRALTAEGGTDLYYPLVEALDSLSEVQARVKHIILLSDGRTVDEYRDYEGLYARLADGEVGVSVVAIGPHPNLQLLRGLVETAGGQLYQATDIGELPEVSVRATRQLSRGRFIEGSIEVDGPLLTGDLAALPALRGYSLTYPKPTAETLLRAGRDPVFVRWRLGGGWVAALNTDLSGHWSADWLAWSRGGTLLDAMLSSVEPSSPVSPGLQLRVSQEEEALHVVVDATDADGGFVEGLILRATVLPDGVEALLPQVGAGLYAERLPLPPRGGYALQVTDETRGRRSAVPFAVLYRAEYRGTGVDLQALEDVAARTGGTLMGPSFALPFVDPERVGNATRPIHGAFLLAALGGFLLELALRKLPRWRPGVRPMGRKAGSR